MKQKIKKLGCASWYTGKHIWITPIWNNPYILYRVGRIECYGSGYWDGKKAQCSICFAIKEL